MSEISAIILAAGANTRLGGVVPPYMKPLILVNGKPLLHHAVDHAVKDWCVEQVIIVVSPDNAKAICSIEDPGRQYILQPQPIGVVDAIQRAIDIIKNEWTVILCADNTFDGFPHLEAHSLPLRPMIAVRDDLSPAEMMRFTRYRTSRIDASTTGYPHRFVDGKDIEIIDKTSPDPGMGVWIGPLLLRTPMIRFALSDGTSNVESFIRKASNNGADLVALRMRCADLGIPEAL